jgi:hypothetical protein
LSPLAPKKRLPEQQGHLQYKRARWPWFPTHCCLSQLIRRTITIQLLAIIAMNQSVNHPFSLGKDAARRGHLKKRTQIAAPRKSDSPSRLRRTA